MLFAGYILPMAAFERYFDYTEYQNDIQNNYLYEYFSEDIMPSFDVLFEEQEFYYSNETVVIELTSQEELNALNLQELPTLQAEFLPSVRTFNMPLHTTGLLNDVYALNSRTRDYVTEQITNAAIEKYLNANNIQAQDFQLRFNNHEVYTNTITYQDQVRLRLVTVRPGESLYLQLDLPNNMNLDYNLYVYDILWVYIPTIIPGIPFPIPLPTPFPNNIIAFSENETYTNNAFGTLPELIEVQNHTSNSESFWVAVKSARGYSATQPFTLHMDFNIPTPPNDEIDQHPNQANRINMNTAGNIEVRGRALQSTVDNDWYYLTILVAGSGFAGMMFTLDAASVAQGHLLEVYIRVPGNQNQFRRLTLTNNAVAVEPGTTYYIRVHARPGVSQLTGEDYLLTITPRFRVKNVLIMQVQGGGLNFGLITGHRHDPMTALRAAGPRDVTIRGIAFTHDAGNNFLVANSPINVVAYSPAWRDFNANNVTTTTTTTTDDRGNFTGTVRVPPGNLFPVFPQRVYNRPVSPGGRFNVAYLRIIDIGSGFIAYERPLAVLLD